MTDRGVYVRAGMLDFGVKLGYSVWAITLLLPQTLVAGPGPPNWGYLTSRGFLVGTAASLTLWPLAGALYGWLRWRREAALPPEAPRLGPSFRLAFDPPETTELRAHVRFWLVQFGVKTGVSVWVVVFVLWPVFLAAADPPEWTYLASSEFLYGTVFSALLWPLGGALYGWLRWRKIRVGAG
ncbi:MAG: hypothetical protein ABFS34_03250 [Gemmatimonadota bacterium]